MKERSAMSSNPAKAAVVLSLLLSLGITWRAPAQEAPAVPDREVEKAVSELKACLKDVIKARDRLADRLDDRAGADLKKGKAHDLFLRLDEGADHEEAHLWLWQRGEQPAAGYAAVPRWRQESFHEQFRYLHRGMKAIVLRDRFRFPADGAGLTIADRSLEGNINIRWRIDDLKEDRFPAGTRIRFKDSGEVFTQMEIMGLRSHKRVRPQRHAVHADILKDVLEFELILERGMKGIGDVRTTFQVPQQNWVTPTVWAAFNCGHHMLDASGLSFKGNELSGKLSIILNPDCWWPDRPYKVTYDMRGKFGAGVFEGTFAATGDRGEYEGRVTGRVGNYIVGRYDAEGDMGVYSSSLSGRIMERRIKVSDALADLGGGLPAEPAQAVNTLAGRIHDAYHQVRALHLAWRRYPMAIEEVLRQTALPAPRWTGSMTRAQLGDCLAYAAGTVAAAESGVASAGDKPGFLCGIPAMPDPTFGPYYETDPLKKKDGAYVLPEIRAEGPQIWRHVPEWSLLGPLPNVDNMDNDFAELPDVISAFSAKYPIQFRSLPGDQVPKGTTEMLRGWTNLVSDTGRLEAPWSRETLRHSSPGSVWFTHARVVSDRDQSVWIAVSGRDHAKLWVNGTLVWTADEMHWRNENKRDAVFKVGLKKGVNAVLLKCREDRWWTWARFRLCVQGSPGAVAEPQRAAPPAGVVTERGDGSYRYPDADPPLAWDLEKGVNVAWKRTLGDPATTRLTAGNDRLFYCTDPHVLVCLDQKNGREVWRRESNILELTDKAAYEKWGRAGTVKEKQAIFQAAGLGWNGVSLGPATDGKTVWVVYKSGVAAAYTVDGKRKWMVSTGIAGPNLCIAGGVAALEGSIASAAPVTDKHPIVGLDAETGETKWEKELPGAFRWHIRSPRLRGYGKAVDAILTSTMQVLDARTGETLLSGVDADPAPGSYTHVADNTLFFGKLSRTTAMQFFVNPHGRVGQRFLFRNHYGVKYDRSVHCTAAGDWFIVDCTVQEDCKGHSNAAYREIYAYDRRTGRPVRRIKPILWASQQETWPVVAGPYLFVLDSGGGASGGNGKYGQIAVVRIDGMPKRVSSNYVELGTAMPPAFAGKRMFLRKDNTVTCVAVTTEKGRRYQDERIAATLFEELGDAPPRQEFPALKAYGARPDSTRVPLARVADDYGVVNWLYAGPFPAEEDEKALFDGLAALRPETGSRIEIGGRAASFGVLGPGAVYEKQAWVGSYFLCGIGNATASIYRDIDAMSAVEDRKNRYGLFFTVLDNSRLRVVSLIAPPEGVDYWIGGRKVRAYDAVRLEAGCYPLLLRVGPEFYKDQKRIGVSFKERDDPTIARRTWLKKVNEREEELEWVSRTLADSEHAGRVGRFLTDLEDYKVLIDLAGLPRSWRGNGSGRFPNSRPPVPWERAANMLWKKDLGVERGSSPVAIRDRVLVGLNPDTILCCSGEDGQELWRATLGAKGGGGPAISAPAVGLEGIYAASSSGDVAALNRQGEMIWSRRVSKPREGWDGTPSVVIAGKTLVAQLDRLHGLDRVRGGTLWSLELRRGAAFAPPVPFEVGGQSVVVTGDGRIIDARGGVVLVDGLPSSGGRSPNISASTLAFGADDRKGTVAVYNLPPALSAGMKLEPAWSAETGAAIVAGPLVHDDIVYVVSGKARLCTLALDSGKSIYEEKLAGKPGGGTDILLAGRNLYLTDIGPDHRTVIVRPGSDLGKVWEYAVDGALVPDFLGRNQFIRSGRMLYAVGGIPPREPEQLEMPDLAKMEAGYAPPKGVPVAAFKDNVTPPDWLVAGPFKPRSLDIDFLKPIGGRGKARPTAGQAVRHDGKEIAFQALGRKCLWRHPKFTAGVDSLDLGEAMKTNWNSTVYFYTVLDNDAPRIVEARFLSPGGGTWNTPDRVVAAMWVGATRVEEGGVLRMPKGKVPVLFQVSLGSVPSPGKIWLAPRFIDRTDELGEKVERHERAAKTWAAYQKRRDELFTLGP